MITALILVDSEGTVRSFPPDTYDKPYVSSLIKEQIEEQLDTVITNTAFSKMEISKHLDNFWKDSHPGDWLSLVHVDSRTSRSRGIGRLMNLTGKEFLM